jgi:hypothetical protein
MWLIFSGMGIFLYGVTLYRVKNYFDPVTGEPLPRELVPKVRELIAKHNR